MNSESDFFRQHPREGAHLVLLGLCFFWQSGIAVMGYILYLVVVQWGKLRSWWLLGMGLSVLALSAIVDWNWSVNQLSLADFIRYSSKLNAHFWKLSIKEGFEIALPFLIRYQFVYLIGFSLILAGLFALIDLYFRNPHVAEMAALQQKKLKADSAIDESLIIKQLAWLDTAPVAGTALGVSLSTAEPIVIKDEQLNQIALVLGTTGAGKTITMRRFYQRAITQGYPLIIVDGKPTPANVEWVRKLADKHQRTFYGFNCGNHAHYNPLANGGYTELKDKIITLKDEWSSDYYRSIAEDYLQTTFEVLLKLGTSFTLKDVARCLTYEELCLKVRLTKDSDLMERVEWLKQYEKSEISGLQAHLHILLHSELGEYFAADDSFFDLGQIIDQNAVVYFALPALKFPSFSKVLGKLVANDLKATIDRPMNKGKKIFTVFDEYSVFAGEQSLNLANMGREKGLHVLFGTQGLADLKKVDISFLEQITNCANTIICHRVNDHVSAELIAEWVGTQKGFVITAQIDVAYASNSVGTVRETREFKIHPDAIKQELGVGEAFYITKVGGFRFDKVRVKYTL